MQRPDLTVVVVTYNALPWLEQCLDSVRGLTDGTPPGTVHYQVRSPGQDWVRGDQ